MSRLLSVTASLLLLSGCVNVAPASTPSITPATPAAPTASPTLQPTASPTLEPTPSPTLEATEEPTPIPTAEVTPVPTAAQACAPVEFPPDLGNDHLDQGEDFTGTYSSTPPTSGPHDPVPTAAGTFYEEPQRVEELVHALEHGAVIFWVNALSAEQDTAARAAVTGIYSQGYESVIWTPYSEMDAPFAMTAWGVLQTCTEIDPVAMQAFVDTYYGSGLEGLIACFGAAAQLPGCTAEPATPAPTGDAFPDAAEAALLEFVPAAFRATCVRPFGEAVGATADLDCFPEDAGADQVSYAQFPSTESLDESYEETREFLAVESSQGQCSQPDQWPAEGTYTIGGEPAGRLLCTVTLGGSSAIMWWTDSLLNIKSLAINSDADQTALYAFWASESGPVRPSP